MTTESNGVTMLGPGDDLLMLEAQKLWPLRSVLTMMNDHTSQYGMLWSGENSPGQKKKIVRITPKTVFGIDPAKGADLIMHSLLLALIDLPDTEKDELSLETAQDYINNLRIDQIYKLEYVEYASGKELIKAGWRVD